MRIRPGPRARTFSTPALRTIPIVIVALALLGIAFAGLWAMGESIAVAGAAPAALSHDAGARSTSGANSVNLCPSAGPTIVGIEWNCVAILNLTEVGLILAGIGLIAYIFRDADRAELPGEAREVPLTAEELGEYRRARRAGKPYTPQDAGNEETDS